MRYLVDIYPQAGCTFEGGMSRPESHFRADVIDIETGMVVYGLWDADREKLRDKVCKWLRHNTDKPTT